MSGSAPKERSLCAAVEARLPAFVDRSLPSGERELVECHLEECDRCARAREELLAVVRTVAEDRPSAEEIEPLLFRLGPALDTLAAGRRTPRRVFFAAAAALLLALPVLTKLPKPDTSLERLVSVGRLIERPISRTVAPLRDLGASPLAGAER